MTLAELHDALKSRDRGMAALSRFMQDCRAGLESDRTHAAAYQLLLSLTARFYDRYDREPLTLEIAQAANDTLLKLTLQARDAAQKGADAELAALNAIAAAELG